MFRRSGFRRAATVGALAAVLLLGACSNSEKGLFTKQRVGSCPSVLMPRNTVTAIEFAPGGGNAPSDVAYRLQIAPLKSLCRYNMPETEIDAEVEVEIAAERGPASKPGELDVSYFVAVVAPGDHILAKGRFEVRLHFGKNQARARATQRTKRKIVLGEGQVGGDFEVLIGLQLTPEQLEYNRRQAKN